MIISKKKKRNLMVIWNSLLRLFASTFAQNRLLKKDVIVINNLHNTLG
jgi:hypothetical protein